ncbi:MAG: glycosyltransferase, partial [Candidatus Bathyarchaeota archaeon]|nr:glycosyltransferase [Candidatus Bathyarchaeota archaeon]
MQEASEDLPSISIVIPTYNSERTLAQCLESIVRQDYTREKIEIIIADGGSKDKTLEIAKKFDVDRILHNPLRTGEAGKAVGVEAAKNEIILLQDSDNVLNEKGWLRRMVEPLEDAGIVGAEPLYYAYRKEDSLITRYCALLGMNDPFCLYLGNYDRYSYVTGKWTELQVKASDDGDYLLLELDERNIPTIGANGFLVRAKALKKVKYKPYLFDIDVVYQFTRM